MSTDLTVFISQPVTPGALCSFVRSELPGWAPDDPLDPRGEPYLSGPFMGLDVAVYDATGFDDDAGIHFSSFRVAICVKRWAGEDNPQVVIDFAKALACVLGSRLKWRLGIDNLVMEDVQELVATFADTDDFGKLAGG